MASSFLTCSVSTKWYLSRYGPLPSELGQLNKMRALVLHTNSFNGTIPSSFAQFSLLGGLYLFNNNLEGTIPECFSKLTSLQALDVSNNKLTGTIPVGLMNLPLQNLQIASNRIRGTIPSSISLLGGTLKTLNLNLNSITGTLPLSLTSCSNLEQLFVMNNQLKGNVFEIFGKWGTNPGYFLFIYANSLVTQPLSNLFMLLLTYFPQYINKAIRPFLPCRTSICPVMTLQVHQYIIPMWI